MDYDKRLENLEKTVEQDQKYNRDAHSKIYDRLGNLETMSAVTDANYGSIMQQLGRLEVKVEDLVSRPIKRYESLAVTILGGVAMIILGAVLGKII